MRQNLLVLGILGAVLLVPSCKTNQAVVTDEEAYRASVEEWKEQRLERLKDKHGWLSLAGLYWLEEGENRFGSDPAGDIVFPAKADPLCGILTLDSGKVTLRVQEGVRITADSVPVTEMVLKNDHETGPTYLQQGDFNWYIVQRGERYGIRLRDEKNPRIDELDHIPAYPVSPDYVVAAELKPFEEVRTMVVATPVEGYTEEYKCPGILEFTLNGQELELYPFLSGDGYFLVIADETTGLDTYGAGRFLYAGPDSTGRIILDFNKAYNPPCAFSPFATCPMPPRENFLPVALEAGEKSVHME